ncbi:DUF4180 domain-containing protein [Eubacteriales bacterium OttesenSCG-928-K08]|nr:DUF4180 domain-containing protein [Eubacteriales bacterium OttesenSCG-928-K08]
MQVAINEHNGSRVAVIQLEDNQTICDPQSALDLLMDVKCGYECSKLVFPKEAFCADFYELKTRLAGEILQKFINYHSKLAIAGDFSCYSSKSLHDFIYECNSGSDIFFLPSVEEAIERLHKCTI